MQELHRTKRGLPGDLTLSTGNTFTGTTTIEEGRIFLGTSNALRFSTVHLTRNYSLALGNYNGNFGALSGNGILFINGSRTITVGYNNESTTYSAALQGGGNVVKVGTGDWTLSGTSTLFGNVDIDEGSIVAGDSRPLPNATVSVNVDNGLDLNGFDVELGALGGSGNIALGAQTLTVGGNDASTTYSGILSGTGGLTKEGTGTFTLSGQNTHTGSTTIDEGVIQLGDERALLHSTVVLNVDNGLTFGSLTDVTLGGLSGTGDLNPSLFRLEAGNNDGDATYLGDITKAGAFTLAKVGTGAWTLQDSTQSFFELQILDGDIVFSGVGGSISQVQAFPGTSATFQNGSTLSITNTFSGGDEVTVSGASTNISIDTLEAFGTLLVDQGANLEVDAIDLDGTAINVDAATLTLNAFAAGNTDATIALNDPTASAALTFDLASDATFAGVISDYNDGTGGILKTGAGTLILTGANTHSGTTRLNEGFIQLSNDYALQNSTLEINVDNGIVFDPDANDLVIGALAGSGDIDLTFYDLTVGGNDASTTYSGNLTRGSSFNKDGSGTLTLTGDGLNLPYFELDEGDLVFDGSGGRASTIVGSTGTSVTFQNGATTSVTGTLANTGVVVTGGSTAVSINLLDGANSLLVEDGAQLTVTSHDSHDALSIVDRASLTLKSFGVFEASASYQISDPVSGSALTLDLANDETFSGTIQDYTSGPGSVTKTGAGTLTLTANNTHTGTTSIDAGQILLGNALALQNSTVAINIDNGLDLNGNDATLGGLSGSGNLALGSQTLTVGGNSASTTYSGVLSGSGSLTKQGAGTLTLSGANSYSGETLINAGTLLVNNTLGTGGVTVADGGTLGGSGTINGLVQVQNGGFLAPGNSPGTLTIDSLSLDSDATLTIQLGGTTQGTSYDFLSVTNTASLGGTLLIEWYDDFTASEGDTFTFLTAGSGITGDFNIFHLPTLDSGLAWTSFNDGNNYTINVVPEPSTLGLVFAGLFLFASKRRRK